MARRTIETDIGEHRWTTMTLGAKEGLELLGYVGSILGESLDSLKGAAGEEQDPKQLAIRVAGGLLKGVGRPETVAKIERLLGPLFKQDAAGKGAKVVFNDEFAGNYGLLPELIAWCWVENFGSFFSESPIVADLVARARGRAEDMLSKNGSTPSRPTSTGESPES